MAFAAPPPPPPGDGAFSINFNIGVMGWTRGLVYSFRNPEPLQGALVQRSNRGRRGYEHNQTLAQIGDDIARVMCKKQWRLAGHTKGDFHDKYEGRASNETFLGYVAESQGLSRYITRAVNGPSTFTNHEKADVVEALIGALYQDCDGAAGIMEDVLRGFGICYPVTREEEAEIERVWDLARRAEAEEYAARRNAERWQEYWQQLAAYYAQGGSWGQ